MRCAEKLISPPADLHSLAPSKESAWEGNLKKKKEQSSSSCMNFHQEPENWNPTCKIPCSKEPQEINMRSFAPWTYIFCRWLLEMKTIVFYLLNLLWFYGRMQKNRRSLRDMVTTVSPRSAELKYKSCWTVSTMTVALGFPKWAYLSYSMIYCKALCIKKFPW